MDTLYNSWLTEPIPGNSIKKYNYNKQINSQELISTSSAVLATSESICKTDLFCNRQMNVLTHV